MKSIVRAILLLIPIGLSVLFLTMPFDNFIFYILFGGILLYLIWLFIDNLITPFNINIKKNNNQSDESQELKYKDKIQSIKNNRSSIEDLRNKGVLSEEEYIEKIKIIEANERENKINEYIKQKSQPQVEKLRDLYNANILTKQEFNLKKNQITEKYRKEIENILDNESL